MREELKNKITAIIKEARSGDCIKGFQTIESCKITDLITDLIDQDQQSEASGVSIDSALASFSKLEAAIREQLALIDEIKTVLNPEPEPKVEEVQI